MRKNLMLTALSFFILAVVSGPVRADESDSVKLSKDLSLGVGYKLWLATWETVIPANATTEGAHLNAIVAGPVAASIPNLSVRYKSLLLTGSYMATGVYRFPAYTDVCVNCTVPTTNQGYNTFPIYEVASRTEEDVNAGYMVSRNLAVTLGYKNVTQNYTSYQLNYGNPKNPQINFNQSDTVYSGATIGLSASGAIGSGFSLYGNGVAGIMDVHYTGDVTNEHDHATYEATEVGIAWRTPHLSHPLSLSFGYKFQYLTTHAPNTAYSGQPAADVTRGYILGLNWLF
jgi:hypothetical protein